MATGGTYPVRTWYGPLGAVVAAENATWNWGAEGGAQPGGLEEFRVDPFGNRLWQRQYYVHPNQADRDGERNLTVQDGRLTRIEAPADPARPNFSALQTFDHDAAGNTWLTHLKRTGDDPSHFEQTASYYDAANRLAVTNRHLGFTQLSNPGGVYEEYRYDALGRRVLVRSRGLRYADAKQGDSGVWSYLERTVWDGDRVLAEVRADGATNATTSDMEDDSPGSSATGGGSPFGRVRYVHALGSAAAGGIDMPVLIERSSVGSSGTLTFAPFVNWRGQVQGAAATPTSGAIPSTVTWPGAQVTLDGLPVTKPNSDTHVWMGNLASQLSDGSGLQYRRNRYYDPATGRFTQPDPIGLAGGLNVYGFAGGDPINFDDPFGLCPIPPQACIGTAIATGGAAVLARVAASPTGQRVAERASQMSTRAASQLGQVQRQLGNILRELAEHDHLAAARLERTGRLQTGFNHAKEVTDFANGLRNSAVRLKQIMSNHVVLQRFSHFRWSAASYTPPVVTLRLEAAVG